MPRLRRVSAASPGWRRRRAGRGFAYPARRCVGLGWVVDPYEAGTTIDVAAQRQYASPERPRAGLEAADLELVAD